MNKKYKIGKSILKSRKGLVLVLGISVLLLLTVSVSASMLINKPVEESPKETTTEATVREDIKPNTENQTDSSEGEVKKESPKQSSPTTNTQAPTSTTTQPQATPSCYEGYVTSAKNRMLAVQEAGMQSLNSELNTYLYLHRNEFLRDDPIAIEYRSKLAGYENTTIRLELNKVNENLIKENCSPIPNVYSIS